MLWVYKWKNAKMPEEQKTWWGARHPAPRNAANEKRMRKRWEGDRPRPAKVSAGDRTDAGQQWNTQPARTEVRLLVNVRPVPGEQKGVTS